ncbi:MAG TPA: OmpH family outer membrane protein [Flavisolibacter sp.]|nr:OmpH family outer membrane protein [Flavisolibacter sp.]
MKNASLILNVVLVVAVAVLFYLHFSSDKKPAETTKVASSTSTGNSASGAFRIAYFELDSVNNSFFMVKEVKAELNKEEEKMNADLARLQRTYNERFTQYQSQAQSQAMSSQESENANRDILQMQQKFASTKQQWETRLQDMSMRKMQDVKNKVEEFLKEYNKSKGYAFIFGYEPGFMFYRDSVYDITSDLVKGLNEKYKKN